MLDKSVVEESLEDYYFLHRYPELSGQEFGTQAYLSQRISELGLTAIPCSATGLVVRLENGEGPTIAYRADMDALPIREQTGLHYASEAVGETADGGSTGVMHACGHDLHMAIALALLRTMHRNRDEWSGTLLVIFQPAEETGQGALSMIADGIWEKAGTPEVLLGQHAWPTEVGTVEVTPGLIMAESDSFEVVVKGRGGHSSAPELTVDPILLSAHIVTRLHSIVSRQVPPTEPSVLSVTTINGGTKDNIIPDEVRLTINMRSFSHATRNLILDAVHAVLVGEAKASGVAKPEFRKLHNIPRLENDPIHVERLSAVFGGVTAPEKVTTGSVKLGSEDFGQFAASINVPQVFWLTGVLKPNEAIDSGLGLHTPHFTPEPNGAIEVGASLAFAACKSYLYSAENEHIWMSLEEGVVK